MFIAVRLDNYTTLPYTNIFILPSVIARASISACLFYILDNTLMEKTLNEKISGTGNFLKRTLKICLGKIKSQVGYLEEMREVINICNGKFSDYKNLKVFAGKIFSRKIFGMNQGSEYSEVKNSVTRSVMKIRTT